MSEHETVEKTVKVPKDLMDILEAENYFGWNSDDFFVVAIRDCISCQMSEMSVEESDALYKKYGRHFDTTAVRIVQTLSQ